MRTRKVHVGTRPQVRGTFRNPDLDPPNDLVNPTTLRVIVRYPDDTQATYTSPNAAITNPSTGVWLFRFPSELTQAGDTWIYFNGDDPADVADEIKLEVLGVHVDV